MVPFSDGEGRRRGSGLTLVGTLSLAGLVVYVTTLVSATAAVAAVSCKDWNTDKFFKSASVADVSRCIKAGADINARNDYKETPLHKAARHNKNPAVITTLVKAGADINARWKWKDTPLHYAAGGNNLAVITTLLEAGADINARGHWKDTPLHYAAAFNKNPAVITTLLRAGADINARADGKRTPLHRAASSNENPAVMTTLLKAGSDINEQSDNKSTPLHYAAWFNKNPAVITTLLRAGADINARDDRKRTPLHRASSNENPAVMTTLLKAGSDINAQSDNKTTPLHHAAWFNENPAVITILVKAGADINARNDYKSTPLHYAAKRNDKNPAMITALVAAGADLNARDRKGRTPRQLAASRDKNKQAFVDAFSDEAVAAFREKERKARAAADRRRIEERVKAARVSCEKWNTSGFFRHADVADVSRCLKTKDPNARDKKGRTPLHKAAMFGKTPAVVAALGKAGAKLNARDGEGRTPLHLTAAFGETPAMVAALVKAGADIKAPDGKGRTPLQFAEKFSKTPAVVTALRKAQARASAPNAAAQGLCAKWNTPAFFKQATLTDLSRCLRTKDANARNEIGRTPLHLAAQGQVPAVVAALAKAGAEVNARDQRGGWTPLHLAAWFGKSPAVIKALLGAGADLEAKDEAGKTPWDYARANPALKEMDFQERRKAVSCKDWNTKAFFERAGAADVSRCLKAGSKVSARDETGRMPLHLAAHHSKTPEVVKSLVNAGARVGARDETGATPLHTAAVASRTPAVVKALLDARADPAAKDETGKTPRDYAKANAALKGADLHGLLARVSCEDWNTEAFFARADAADVSRCLKAGGKVAARDQTGATPLHTAAFKSKTPAVIKALLDNGADPAARDKQDKTPWDYAKRNSNLKGTDVYWQLNEGRFK